MPIKPEQRYHVFIDIVHYKQLVDIKTLYPSAIYFWSDKMYARVFVKDKKTGRTFIVFRSPQIHSDSTLVPQVHNQMRLSYNEVIKARREAKNCTDFIKRMKEFRSYCAKYNRYEDRDDSATWNWNTPLGQVAFM